MSKIVISGDTNCKAHRPNDRLGHTLPKLSNYYCNTTCHSLFLAYNLLQKSSVRRHSLFEQYNLIYIGPEEQVLARLHTTSFPDSIFHLSAHNVAAPLNHSAELAYRTYRSISVGFKVRYSYAEVVVGL